MESVGELLKRERDAQGKTVEDVAKATKMSTLIIEALEADHFSVLPAPVYVKGHLRTYARHLGLNEDAVVDKYLRFTQQLENEELDEWDAVELELHEEKQRVGRRWVWAAVASGVIIVAFVVWWMSGRNGDTPEEVTSVPVNVTSDPVRETVAEDTLIEWHKLQLLAVAKERTWLSVSVDGEPVAAGRLRLVEDGWAKLERIAVRPRWRGRGLARRVVEALLAEAASRGATRSRLHAQVYLEDFYAGYGFRRRGEVFDECGIDHILMIREDG